MEIDPKPVTSSKKLIAISIAYAIWTYIAYRTPFRFYNNFLCFGLICSVFTLTTILFWINLRAFLRGSGPLAFVIYIACVLLPWSIPSITPEELFFAQHKTEYLQAVELARQSQIEHEGQCQYAYLPPKGFEHLTIEDCIFVEYYPALTVRFTPRISRRLLVYAETKEALQAYVSCGGSDGSIGKNIEDHWYICHQDWN